MALTFDDGPDEQSTPRFLDVLAAHDVRATFFLLGEMCERYPTMARRLVDAGARGRRALVGPPQPPPARSGPIDQLAAHRRHHRAADRRSAAVVPPALRRADPRGLLAARKLGLQPVLWTAWGKDWQRTATPASVLAQVQAGGVDGGTILLHDSDCTSQPGSWRAALGALPDLIAWCRDQGIEVGPLRSCGIVR